MTKITKIKFIISFILALFLIIFSFWNRLIRNRLPKTLVDFNNYYGVLSICCTIFILSIIVIYKFYTLFSFKTKNNLIMSYIMRFKFTQYLLEPLIKISAFISEGPKILFEVLYSACNIAKVLEKPFFHLSVYLKDISTEYPYIFTIIYLLCNLLPKVILAIIFNIEIIFYHEIKYFYKLLALLIIPLCYNILLGVLGRLADKSTYFATAHIKIVHAKEGEDFFAMFHDKIPNIEGAVDIISRKSDKKLLEWFVYIYDTYRDIKWFVHNLDLEKQYFKDYEVLFLSLIYILGWLNILYIISTS